MNNNSYPCPSCGFLVFDEPPGSYVICQFCGWEDDHVQLANPAMRGGANSQSLAESQREILNYLPLEVLEHKGVLRDAQWRPLRTEELEVAPGAPKDRTSYFHAASMEGPTYYWLQSENK